ncbi:MAG: ArsA family ATPase [Acidimicrobiia bacterium]|nr:ArsA family ATPase [Acidimicrobiia bacterium]
MRVLLFTGKGGVGKTTTAAATALRCADAGLRTIVLSTDPAHSLADAYALDLGDHPVEISPGLWGQQLDTQARMEDSWVEIQSWLLRVFEWAGVAAIEAEELAVIPGLDEIFGLSDIKHYADSGEWDVVVVDCAPTAETLRLLSLPEILRWYMDRVFPASRKVNKVISPLLGRVSGIPLPGDEVFGSAATFYDRLDGVRELLCDTARTSVRLVVNPERLVVAEARRTHTYLSLFGYRVDAVVANRLLPEAVTDPWFAEWRARHAEHLAAIEEGFAPLPILRAELASDELVGVDALRSFGETLYAGLDAAAVLHPGEPLHVVRSEAGYELVLELPFADKDDLELGRRDDELLIRVGGHRRALLLPDSLRRRPVGAASLRDGLLRVTFAGDSHHGRGGDRTGSGRRRVAR